MNKEWLIWLLLLGALGVYLYAKKRGQLSLEQARTLLNEGAVVIDVRTESEHASVRASGAINIPLDQLSARIESVVPEKKTPILCHCASGVRSGQATVILKDLGYESVSNLGGLQKAIQLLGE